MTYHRIRLIIFAKAPLSGYAKTRLIPALGESGSAALAKRFIVNTAYQATQCKVGRVELCVSPSVEDKIWSTLSLPAELLWSEQGEGDLGQRMARATERAVAAGEHPILIGTDCPHLTQQHLQSAALALQEYNSCIIPAKDGGYVLLGMTEFSDRLFSGIHWSTESVGQETLKRIASLGWSCKVFEPLQDVDHPQDLHCVPAEWLQDI